MPVFHAGLTPGGSPVYILPLPHNGGITWTMPLRSPSEPVAPPLGSKTPLAVRAGRPAKESLMKQEMLINVAQPEECRIAIVEDNTLEELYIERTSQDNFVGNIYKGVVVNLEPSIQAAFV